MLSDIDGQFANDLIRFLHPEITTVPDSATHAFHRDRAPAVVGPKEAVRQYQEPSVSEDVVCRVCLESNFASNQWKLPASLIMSPR